MERADGDANESNVGRSLASYVLNPAAHVVQVCQGADHCGSLVHFFNNKVRRVIAFTFPGQIQSAQHDRLLESKRELVRQFCVDGRGIIIFRIAVEHVFQSVARISQLRSAASSRLAFKRPQLGLHLADAGDQNPDGPACGAEQGGNADRERIRIVVRRRRGGSRKKAEREPQTPSSS